MKYQRKIDEINSGKYSRVELQQIRDNAHRRLLAGDSDAKLVVKAVEEAVPSDRFFIFMGFCPDANVENSQYEEWLSKGICTYHWFKDKVQTEAFENIRVNDLIILKKQNIRRQKMFLHGWGRVKSYRHDKSSRHTLEMEWSQQNQIIEIPLMGATKTVNPKALKGIEEKLPEAFFKWLGDDCVSLD